MGRARAWTPEEKDYLVKYWPDSMLATDEIAEHLGRTKGAVFSMATRLKLKRPVVFTSGGPEAYKRLSCYGTRFTRECVDSCPGWLACMELETDTRVKRDFKLTRSYRAEITGKWDGASIARAIREALDKFDQAEVI